MRDLLRLAGILTLVCLLAGIFLSTANKGTEKARMHQDRLARLEAIDAVLPPYDNRPDEDKVDVDGKTFYIGRKDGRVIGVAFLTEEMGYGGSIKVMIGVSPKGKLLGIDVVSHLETPGLGAKIDEPGFKEQFFKCTIDSRIDVVKDGGEIEAVTGATISSRAVCKAVKEGLRLFNDVKDRVLGGK